MARIRYKANFAFQRNQIPDAQARVGKRQGALVKTIARRSIRKARRVAVDDLGLMAWQRYEQAKALGQGDNRPFAPSKPGEPPRSRTGLLKKFIFYSWDSGRQAVVIGPEKLSGGSDAPAVLEGTKRRRRLRPRPYMKPALMTSKNKLPELWRGAIK